MVADDFAFENGAKHCHEYVCLSVCLSASISRKSRGQTSPKFSCMLHMAVARFASDSVAIMLCTSGFVDDVTFSHNDHMARRVYSQAAMDHDKQNSRDSRQILLDDTDQGRV